jgi:hypothetical protein
MSGNFLKGTNSTAYMGDLLMIGLIGGVTFAWVKAIIKSLR